MPSTKWLMTHECTSIPEGMQGDARGCKGMRGDARGCEGMQGDARGCKGMRGSVPHTAIHATILHYLVAEKYVTQRDIGCHKTYVSRDVWALVKLIGDRTTRTAGVSWH